MRSRQPETDFARGVRQFGMRLIRVMLVIVPFVLTVNVLLDRPVIESSSMPPGSANPLDRAIVANGKHAKLTTAGYTKVDAIPYDFMRRRLR